VYGITLLIYVKSDLFLFVLNMLLYVYVIAGKVSHYV